MIDEIETAWRRGDEGCAGAIVGWLDWHAELELIRKGVTRCGV